MEKLPEDVMIEEILLKLPVSSLLNLRYVAKDFRSLITSPSFLLRHVIAQLNNNPSLLISSHLLDYRKPSPSFLVHNFLCNFPIITSSSTSPKICPETVEMHIPFESTEIRASCNGLLYLHQNFVTWIDRTKIDDISYYIWNPCTREYKQLPPPPPLLLVDGVDVRNYPCWDGPNYLSSSGFCGFGYDRNNDVYKILHFENSLERIFIPDGRFRRLHSISSVIEFKLYTLGTNKWTSIADNPYRLFYFTDPSKRTGLLVNGALHWTMSLSDLSPKAGKIISFDIEKEVFGEIQKPRYYYYSEEKEFYYSGSLQILQECLCICKVHFHEEEYKIDIWMLQDYDVMDSWTKLFRVVIPGREEFNYYQFRLLRSCENGEIVMLRNKGDVIVYDPVNHKIRCAEKFNKSIPSDWKYFMDYTESLVCLNSGTYSLQS